VAGVILAKSNAFTASGHVVISPLELAVDEHTKLKLTRRINYKYILYTEMKIFSLDSSHYVGKMKRDISDVG
jgi:hypothetical protein